MLTPILLKGFGRTGSTLLMELLGSSSNIVFEPRYPYETRYLTQILQSAKIFKIHCDVSYSKEESLAEFEGGAIASKIEPFKETSLIEPAGTNLFWKNYLLSVWREFSDSVLNNVSDNKGDVKFYAEKVDSWVGPEIQGVIDSKIVYRVRDPRDVWLSIISFDRKRGYYGFGRQNGESESDYLQRFIKAKKEYFSLVMSVLESHKNIVIKYEDLALNPIAVGERLSDWLDVAIDVNGAIGRSEEFEHHKTTDNAKSSVYKWHDSMSAGLNDIFVEHLRDELTYFGYAHYKSSKVFYKEKKSKSLFGFLKKRS